MPTFCSACHAAAPHHSTTCTLIHPVAPEPVEHVELGGDNYTDHPAGKYASLQLVLDQAFNQAAFGKGAERHAKDLPFEQQPMQTLMGLYGIGFALGQAGKKMEEAQRMEVEPAVRELLGAINYIAGVIIHLEKSHG